MALDITEAQFQAAVLDRSHQVPVIVDFWAAWCGPCRQLTPILEAVAAEYAGRVDLVKVDTDANQALAMQMGIQGIPAVKAFWQGALVGEFTGAQPEMQVRQFFGQLDELTAKAGERSEILAQAQALFDAGDAAGARTLLAQLPADDEVSRLLADIDLAEEGVSLDDPETMLKGLLEQVRAGEDREEARERMVKIFEVLGPDHPLVARYRVELANALF